MVLARSPELGAALRRSNSGEGAGWAENDFQPRLISEKSYFIFARKKRGPATGKTGPAEQRRRAPRDVATKKQF